MVVQVGYVHRNLASFMKMLDADNDIHLSKRNASYIQDNQTMKRTPARVNKNLPEFDLWLPRQGDTKGQKKEKGFCGSFQSGCDAKCMKEACKSSHHKSQLGFQRLAGTF